VEVANVAGSSTFGATEGDIVDLLIVASARGCRESSLDSTISVMACASVMSASSSSPSSSFPVLEYLLSPLLLDWFRRWYNEAAFKDSHDS